MGELTGDFYVQDVFPESLRIPGCKNFYWNEFINHRPNSEQKFLIRQLANMLQPARTIFNTPFIVTSGVRNRFKVDELRAKGYAVGTRTDHSYLDSEIWKYGVGAVDFTLLKDKLFKLRDIFKWLVAQNLRGLTYFGQIIYYPPHPGGYPSMDSIHVSNPPTLVYASEFIPVIRGGKRNYLIYSPEQKRFLTYKRSLLQ